ncbi:hypothetical protein TYRP_017541 [Tyrophagus putrescentiae]|nr:hypothetical protein TYRP_017541 [Tyrophagus putrescentiae]
MVNEPRLTAGESSGDASLATRRRLAVASFLPVVALCFYDDTCPDTPPMPQWAKDACEDMPQLLHILELYEQNFTACYKSIYAECVPYSTSVPCLNWSLLLLFRGAGKIDLHSPYAQINAN